MKLYSCSSSLLLQETSKKVFLLFWRRRLLWRCNIRFVGWFVHLLVGNQRFAGSNMLASRFGGVLRSGEATTEEVAEKAAVGFLHRWWGWWELRRRNGKWRCKSWWICFSKSTTLAATVARDDELPVASLHGVEVRKVCLSELRLAMLRRNMRLYSKMLEAVVRRLTTVDANMSKTRFALGSKLVRATKLKCSVVPTEVSVLFTFVRVIKPDGKSVSRERLNQIERDSVVCRRHDLNVFSLE